MIISILNLVSNYCRNKDPEFGSPLNFIGLILIKYVNFYPFIPFVPEEDSNVLSKE